MEVPQHEPPGTGRLEHARQDYMSITSFLPMICKKITSATFQHKDKCGIIIKTLTDRMLALLSNGEFAIIMPLNDKKIYKKSEIVVVRIEDVIDESENKENDLTKLLDQQIGVVTELIYEKHRYEFPEHYAIGSPYITLEQHRKLAAGRGPRD
jgi:hypothetical protein